MNETLTILQRCPVARKYGCSHAGGSLCAPTSCSLVVEFLKREIRAAPVPPPKPKETYFEYDGDKQKLFDHCSRYEKELAYDGGQFSGIESYTYAYSNGRVEFLVERGIVFQCQIFN